MWVTYNKNGGKNGKGSLELFKNYITEIPEATESARENIKTLFDQIESTEYLDKYKDDLSDLFKRYNVTDKSLQDFLITTKESGTVYNNAEEFLAGYNTYLKETAINASKASAANKLLTASAKALSSIGWMALITGISTVINLAISSEEDITTAINNASNSLNDQNSSLKDNTDKIKELREALDSGNLSYEDATAKRSELIDIQSSLIKSYGDEANGIDLVNGSLEEQLGLLDDIEKKNIQEAINKANEKSGWQKFTNFLGNTMGAGGFYNLLNTGKWDANAGLGNWQSNIEKANDRYSNFSKKFKITGIDELDKVIESFDNIEKKGNTFEISGNADEVKDTINELQSALQGSANYSDELNQQLTDIYNKASKVSDKWKNGNDLFYMNQIINDNSLSSYYEQAEKAYNDYLDAVQSGNEINKDEAIKEYQNVLDGLIQSGASDGMVDYFKNLAPELQTVFDDYTFNINIQPQLDDSNSDLSKNTNLLNDFSADELSQKWDDLSYGVAVGLTDAQQEALISLNSFATQYGLTLDELLAKLESLGYLKDPLESKREDAKSYIVESNPMISDKGVVNDYINSLSDEELDLILSISVDEKSKIKTVQDLKDFVENANNEINNITPLSFSEAWSQLQSTTDESTKDLSDDLLELAKAGQLTEDAFKAKDTTNYFDELGISAQKAVEEINKLVDESDQLSSMSSQISKMSDALVTKQSDGYVSADTLSGFDAEVRGLDSWDEFQDKVGSSTSSLEECKQAASALATEWVNSKNFLSQLNDSNVDYYDTQLMLMGVENHREIVTEALAQKTQLLAAEELYEQKIASTTSENSAKTINNMIEQGKVTDDAAKALAAYTLQAQYCNDNAIFTNGSCNNLLDLAHVAGVTGEALQQLQTLIQLLNSGQIMAKTRITNIQNRIKEILNDNYKKNYSIGVGVNVSTAGSGGGKSGSGSSGSGSSETDTSKEYDWISIGIQRCQEAITRLNKVEENTYDDWSNRNQSLIGEIDQIAKEIDLLQRSYQGYMDAANSIGLSEEYKQKVRNGTIQIETITDKNLQEQIDNYQDLYNKAINCSDQIQELNIQLSDLAKKRFDNVVKQFEELEGVFTSLNDIINAQIDYVEARGRLVSKSYYEAMLRNENENNKLLVQQRDAMVASLNDAINSGRIKEGSESWYDLTKQISEANKAIVESNKSIVEFSNNIRQLDWDVFDLIQDKITGIADEIEFVQSLLDDRDNLTDGHLNRGLTNEGIAQLGNYASKYNIYMSQAEKYASEIKKIEADIAKDPANQDLINRKEELVKAQRDVILSANDEKKSMIDLARNGYDAILDVLQELIDKKKEQLSAEKELYDYQKSIQEKSDNIANIKKQLSVFENDNSEEALKKVQQLRSDLNDAESDLQDAEYEKYISDQENMLDQFYQEYSDKIDEKFEQTEILIQELIGVVNENQSSISDTITTVTSDVGYTISDQMKTIWNDAGTVISGFTGKFDTYATTVQSAINSIQVTIDKMLQIAQAEANKSIAESFSGNVSGIGSSSGSSGSTSSGNSPYPTPQASTSVPSQPQASVGTRISAASGRWYYDSYGTAPTGDVNRFHPDYFEIDRIVQGRAYPYHIQAYIRGKRAGGNGWVKGNQIGYKNGLKEATYDHWAWTQEDGMEMIRGKDGALYTPVSRGTTVFTREMTDNLWNIAQQNPEKFYRNVMPAMNTFATTNRSGDVTVSIGDIRLDGIQNPEQFAHQLINVVQNNSRVQKTLQAGTVDLLNGQSAKRINRF